MSARLWRGVIYTPTKTDRALAHSLAAARWLNKTRAGIVEKQDYTSRRTGQVNHEESILAEIAVVKLVPGTRYDESISVAGNKHGNLMFMNGQRGFVKYRSERGKDFALDREDMSGFLGDLGFLCYAVDGMSGPTEGGPIEVYGWVTRDDFEARSSRRNMPRRNEKGWMEDQFRLVVAPTKMRPFQEFLNGVIEQEPLLPMEDREALDAYLRGFDQQQ